MVSRVLGALCASIVLLGAAPGKQAAVPSGAHRIVSLIPSLTEDLFAIGAGSAVVAVSDYTDFPPAAKRLPVVATFASVASERIIALHPDLVVGIPAQAALVGDLRRAGVRVVLVEDDSYDDIFRDLRLMGDLTGRRSVAEAVIGKLQARTEALRRTVARTGRQPSVFVVLGDAPIYTVGNASYIARLIMLAGGRNAAGDLKRPYGVYSADALVAKQPDVLILASDARMAGSMTRSPWRNLRAVQRHRVVAVPPGLPLARPGPRYDDGLAWLIGVLRKARS